MEIIIENCSSPGAHFSANTNRVMLKIYHWIQENYEISLPFIDFRRRLENEEHINDNNARNIYPLLKNGGLVEYHAGGDLALKEFFTNRGLAYLKALETRDLIEESDYSEQKKREAQSQVDEILSTIVCDSVQMLVENKELAYSKSLQWYLLYLSKFKKINKQEFALMIYEMNKDESKWESEIKPIIEQYRSGQIDINVKVRVRNDRKIQENTGETTRLEDIGFFTAYSFYSSLIDQAGLTKKVHDYHCVIENKSFDYLVEV